VPARSKDDYFEAGLALLAKGADAVMPKAMKPSEGGPPIPSGRLDPAPGGDMKPAARFAPTRR